MSKYSDFLTPAYSHTTTMFKSVQKESSTCELPFTPDDNDAITMYYPQRTGDTFGGKGLVTKISAQQLNNIQRMFDANFEPINDEFMKASIMVVTLFEGCTNITWRLLIHDGNIVQPSIDETIYYNTWMSRIAVTDASEKRSINGYAINVMYAHDSKLKVDKEKIFRDEMISKFLV